MEIKSISLHDLRKMNDSEGLVLQGCGGDLQEWVDGINDMLTDYIVNNLEECVSEQDEDLEMEMG